MIILVTGASGYVGSVLVPALLENGHDVVALDTFWFGDNLEDHPKLQKIHSDVRIVEEKNLPNFEAVIHLAAIANDPSVELDPGISWEIGCLGTLNICNIAKQKKVKTFILASSGSVYGIKEDAQVTEDLSLVPISVYNKVKMIKEKVVLSFLNDFRVVIFRPATICGWSPRLRLDLAVNALTFDALEKKQMRIFGGSQMRPQLHIQDMVAAYCWAIEKPEIVGVFNVGFENDSILEIANNIIQSIPADLVVEISNDPRSYRLNSDKLLNTGYRQLKSTSNAIDELKKLHEDGNLKCEAINLNVEWMQQTIFSSKLKA
jgi:nucleoside-diphosphate-sugar epimerase